jgi:hypothetical protein
MVRPGELRRYVDLTLLAAPLQDSLAYKIIISEIQVLLCPKFLSDSFVWKESGIVCAITG